LEGGSGQTTLAALSSVIPPLILDADINHHLAAVLGMAEDEAVLLPALGDHLAEIKDYLR